MSTSRKFIQYEHQVFSEKGIPSLTITAKGEKAAYRSQKYSAFDKVLQNDEVKRNVQIISEAIVHVVYGFHEASIKYFIDNESIVEKSYIDQI